MNCDNIFNLCDKLADKLYKFNGRHVDPSHTSTMFDAIARDCDWLKKNPAAKSLVYSAEIYVCGRAIPVYVTITGSDIYSPMSYVISRR